LARDDEINQVLDTIFEDLKTVGSVPTMLHGLQELTAELNDSCLAVDAKVNQVLTDFFTLRTGMRFLIQHYIECRQRRRYGYSGILQLSCAPAKLAKAAVRDSTKLCQTSLGQAPAIKIRGDRSETLTYVPTVLQYMLNEIFKNACRAVVERHAHSGYDDILPPVICQIDGTLDGVTITIRDEGGGMSAEQLGRVFDFLYTTYKPAWNGKAKKTESGTLAGYGVGLPLSRMYARYFGGDLVAKSTEGVGTEVSIHLCRSPVCSEVLPADFWLDFPSGLPIEDSQNVNLNFAAA
jgi:pyruvate dehydrogenase kinase 2/3/4